MPSGPKGYGVIQCIPCEYHIQAEWHIEKPLCFLINLMSWQLTEICSPEINCMDERFKLKWVGAYSLIGRHFDLNVYSRRLSTRSPYSGGRWWVALKWPDGTYHMTNVKGTGENDSHLWMFRGSILLPYKEGGGGDLTVIFRYTTNDVPKDPDFSCVHSSK